MAMFNHTIHPSNPTNRHRVVMREPLQVVIDASPLMSDIHGWTRRFDTLVVVTASESRGIISNIRTTQENSRRRGNDGSKAIGRDGSHDHARSPVCHYHC